MLPEFCLICFSDFIVHLHSGQGLSLYIEWFSVEHKISEHSVLSIDFTQ